MCFRVRTTLVMRWPVMSWKLQASKMRVTAWVSSARGSGSTFAAMALMTSHESMIWLVASSVAPTTASSSSVALAICSLLMSSGLIAAISRLACWM